MFVPPLWRKVEIMAVVVRDLLELDLFREMAELVAGHKGLDRTVSFVTIMEAPDFYEWVDGGEFVLTTWYAFSQRPELQRDAFLQLSDKIAAIGIKLGRFIREIPQEIIDLANEKGVPVFVIRREAKFREVIQSIAAEVNNYQANLLLEVNRHYQETARIALADNDIRTFLQGLSKRGNFSCGFFDAHGEWLAGVSPGGGTLQAAEVGGYMQKHLQVTEFDPLVFRHSDNLYFFPCTARQLLLGTLVVLSDAPLSEKLTMMANNLTTFLTLRLLDEVETVQKNLSALLDDVFYRRSLSDEQVRGKFALFGLRCQTYFRVFVVRSLGAEGSAETIKTVRTQATRLQNLLRNTIAIIEPDEVIIIHSSPSADESLLRSQLRKFAAAKESAGIATVIGIGPVVTRIGEMELSYRMARQTIKVGQLGKEAGFLFASDYLIHNLAMSHASSPEVALLWGRTVDSLLRLDTAARETLLSTLDTVVGTESLEAAACLLGVHENTVRYRMKRIAEITGQDYSQSSGRVVLTLASLMIRFRQMETPG